MVSEAQWVSTEINLSWQQA